MNRASELTLAFINKRPESAARVLASIPASDAAAFTASIPTRYAVRLLAHLNAKSAAAIIRLTDIMAATAVVRDMEFSAAAAILRQVPSDERELLLADLPRRQRRGFLTSLAFAPDSVGAHMSTSVDALSANDTAADALRLKKDHQDSHSELIFVVDANRALIGIVTLLSLIQHAERTELSELMDTTCVSVSPNMRLAQIANLDIWHRFSQLPVVSRRGELLGAIFRQTILATRSTFADGPNFAVQTITGTTLQMMGDGALGLFEMLTTSPSDQHGPGGFDVS